LIGWTRVVAGRIRDPIVGYDVLVGLTCGGLLALLTLAPVVVPRMIGLPEPTPHTPEFPPLFGLRGTMLTLFGAVNQGMQNMLITTFEFAGFRALVGMITRRLFGWTSERVFIGLAIFTLTLVSVSSNNQGLSGAMAQAVSLTLSLNVLLLGGIFTATVMFFTSSFLLRMPFSLDSSAFYASQGWFALALLLGLAAIGYWMAAHPRREVWRST